MSSDAANAILKTIPTIQTADLASKNYNLLKKKKKKVNDFLKLGVTNITATSLIKSEGDFLWV